MFTQCMFSTEKFNMVLLEYLEQKSKADPQISATDLQSDMPEMHNPLSGANPPAF